MATPVNLTDLQQRRIQWAKFERLTKTMEEIPRIAEASEKKEMGYLGMWECGLESHSGHHFDINKILQRL
jgi:hypothetical protein